MIKILSFVYLILAGWAQTTIGFFTVFRPLNGQYEFHLDCGSIIICIGLMTGGISTILCAGRVWRSMNEDVEREAK